jgi:hypothetical protein
MNAMSYDPKCYELAEHFLPSMAREPVKVALAQVIQDAVEDHLGTEAMRLALALETKQ